MISILSLNLYTYQLNTKTTTPRNKKKLGKKAKSILKIWNRRIANNNKFPVWPTVIIIIGKYSGVSSLFFFQIIKIGEKLVIKIDNWFHNKIS